MKKLPKPPRVPYEPPIRYKIDVGETVEIGVDLTRIAVTHEEDGSLTIRGTAALVIEPAASNTIHVYPRKD